MENDSVFSLTLPLTFLNNRGPIQSHGAPGHMAARVERGFVIATGPDVVTGAEADHSRLNPITELTGRPKLQVGIDPKVHIAEQIFARVVSSIIVLLQRIKAWSRSSHRSHFSSGKHQRQVRDFLTAIEFLRNHYFAFGSPRRRRGVDFARGQENGDGRAAFLNVFG